MGSIEGDTMSLDYNTCGMNLPKKRSTIASEVLARKGGTPLFGKAHMYNPA